MYYAEVCPYGLNLMSSQDYVVGFDEKHQREAWLTDKKDKAHAITIEQARRVYGFNFMYIPHELCDYPETPEYADMLRHGDGESW